jgi:hypothetical protein
LFEDVEIDPEARSFERGSARGRSRWSPPYSYDFVDHNSKHASGSGWWSKE